MINDKVRGFIGDGLITEVILSAAGKQAGVNPAEIYVICKSKERCVELREQYNVRAVVDAEEFLSRVEILALALPFDANVERELSGINEKIPSDTLIISCMYGLQISTLEKYFPGHPVIRFVMNPMIVAGAGVCAYAVGSVNPADSENISQFFLKIVGRTIKVASEAELETVGDLIISGTIYSFVTMNALIESGRKNGLEVEKAREIVSQIFTGVNETVTNPDAVVEYLIKQGQAQKKYFEHGKKILADYGIIDYMSKALAKADVNEIVKFRYHYWR